MNNHSLEWHHEKVKGCRAISEAEMHLLRQMQTLDLMVECRGMIRIRIAENVATSGATLVSS